MLRVRHTNKILRAILIYCYIIYPRKGYRARLTGRASI